ncbi:hypothetical protein D3C73_1614180 [compost metagenome]
MRPGPVIIIPTITWANKIHVDSSIKLIPFLSMTEMMILDIKIGSITRIIIEGLRSKSLHS